MLRPLLLFFGEQREAALADLDRVLLHDEDPWARAAARSIRLAFAENDGDLETMRTDVAVGLAEWEAIGDRWGLAALLTSRAQLRTLDGDLVGAAETSSSPSSTVASSAAPPTTSWWRCGWPTCGCAPATPTGPAATSRPCASTAASGWPSRCARCSPTSPPGRSPSLTATATEMLAARDRLLADLTDSGEADSFRAHAGAVGWAAAGSLDLHLGDVDQAPAHVCEGYRLAVATNDLPILASVGLTVAELAVHHGLHRRRGRGPRRGSPAAWCRRPHPPA